LSGAIPPPQYAFTAWWSIKAQGELYLYQDIGQWQALVYVAINLRVP